MVPWSNDARVELGKAGGRAHCPKHDAPLAALASDFHAAAGINLLHALGFFAVSHLPLWILATRRRAGQKPDDRRPGRHDKPIVRASRTASNTCAASVEA